MHGRQDNVWYDFIVTLYFCGNQEKSVLRLTISYFFREVVSPAVLEV